MTKVDVKKYATLARIAVSDEEAQDLEKDIESILDYVGPVQECAISDIAQNDAGAVYNIFREDKDPHESGAFTEKLMNEAPKTKKKDGGAWVEVKKIL